MAAIQGLFRLSAGIVCLMVCAGLAKGAGLSADVNLFKNGDDDAGVAAARAASMAAFKSRVTPFMNKYCVGCHSAKKQKGGITFQGALNTPASSSIRELWTKATAQIKTHNMPPEEKDQPSDQERQAVVDWIAGMKILSPKDPGEFIIRRLNRTEYGNTLHDLFGVDPKIASELPDEVFGAGYTNSLSPLLMEGYLSVANEVLNRILSPTSEPPTAMQRRLFGDDPGGDAERKSAARQAAQSIARQAYRRPPSQAEIDLLLHVFALASDQGKPYAESLRLMFKAVLMSPQFLFITPAPADAREMTEASHGSLRLDDHQLASRLSYLLWATMPDAELSALADAGKLHNAEVLAAQARRLIDDPRSRALFDGFGAQWLGLDKLATKPFDDAMFPQMTAALRTSMYDEARLFFESIVRGNRSLATFIDSDYTFLNDGLAALYGMPAGAVSGPVMRKVALNNANRGGVLTMPAVLATSSFPNRTSPVNRGVWVLEQVLGEEIPPPPADVPPLDKNDHEAAALTLRQRTEMHRADPVCANCHKLLDPIGFGLENFDAIGRWRSHDDSGGTIDATGELPNGQRFSSPRELKRMIAARTDDFCHNLSGKLLAYALCRQLEGYDEVVVDQISRAVAADGHRMQTLVVQVVTSYPFTHCRQDNEGDPTHAK